MANNTLERARISIAFVLGVIAAGILFEVVLKSLSPYGLAQLQWPQQLASGLSFAVLVFPGAFVGFVQARPKAPSLAQSALLGALFWALFVSLVDRFGRLGLGVPGGIAFFLVAPGVVAYLGSTALEWGKVHG